MKILSRPALFTWMHQTVFRRKLPAKVKSFFKAVTRKLPRKTKDQHGLLHYLSHQKAGKIESIFCEIVLY